jgi:hypothetical protein
MNGLNSPQSQKVESIGSMDTLKLVNLNSAEELKKSTFISVQKLDAATSFEDISLDPEKSIAKSDATTSMNDIQSSRPEASISVYFMPSTNNLGNAITTHVDGNESTPKNLLDQINTLKIEKIQALEQNEV